MSNDKPARRRTRNHRNIVLLIDDHERLKRLSKITFKTMQGCVAELLWFWEEAFVAGMKADEQRRYLDGSMDMEEARVINRRMHDNHRPIRKYKTGTEAAAQVAAEAVA
jgi:hypothetical protein